MLASPLPAPPTTLPAQLRQPEAPPSGLRRDVFTIGDDGEVVVTLPSTMTQQTYDDLKDWLDLIGRKAQRKIAVSQPRSDDTDA